MRIIEVLIIECKIKKRLEEERMEMIYDEEMEKRRELWLSESKEEREKRIERELNEMDIFLRSKGL